MGFMCSWIAIHHAAKDDVLGALGLIETNDRVEPGSGEARMSWAERGEWLVVFSEDFDWAGRDRILDLSRFGLTVGCQFEDKVEMTSIATGAQDGKELWRVSHANLPKERLNVSGEPPAEFAAIRDRLLGEQAENGGDEADADYLHDIPLEVAKAACGFRLDEDMEPFIRLENPSAMATRRSEPRGPGLFARLFGKRT